MRRPKKKYNTSVSFTPYQDGPQNLKREKAVPEQKNWSENTILYGEDDALPLRIAQAVEDSPAAASCTATVAQFIKGAGFSDPALMDLVIDDAGTTLWTLHESLSECLALFEGFAVNHKYHPNGKKITQAYMLGFEGCRMTMPMEGSPIITSIKHNPYFGTNEWKKHYTECYPVHNPSIVKDEIDAAEELQKKDPNYRGYPGQVYFYGKTSPIHRFYPVPSYWSARNWIYIDGQIQVAHKTNLDNGFFQSVLMKLIGDPNSWSTNPRYQDDKGKSTKTVGEEFGENMANNFSGSKKMGGVMALWGLNNASLPEIEAFPTTANADLFLALQDLTTKNITIARRVPPILSNISEGVSLGSGGSEIQKAVELMQSRVTAFQNVLMNYYNRILLPGMGVKGQVMIQHFTPVTTPVEIDDKFWEVLTTEEKREFIRMNIPGIKLTETVAVEPMPADQAEPVLDDEGNPIPQEPAAPPPSEALKNLTEQQLNRILSASKKFLTGRMTYEQAKARIMSFGLTAAEADLYLLTNEEEDATDTTGLS